MPDSDSVDTAAKALRKEFAAREGPRYVQDFNMRTARNAIAQSIFADHIDSLPCDEPELVVSFNLHLSESIVDHLCEVSSDPMQLAFFSSRALELAGYSLLDPRPPFDVINHLGPSKMSGYFFTPPEISLLMADKLLSHADDGDTVLDPSAGCGSLLVALMIRASAKRVELGSITAIEIDRFTSTQLAKILSRVSVLTRTQCEIKVVNGNALHLLSPAYALSLESTEVGAGLLERYDGVIMNPPYGRLRFLRSFLTNRETQASRTCGAVDELEAEWKRKMRVVSDRVRGIARSLGAGGGIQDYPRVFMALAFSRLSKRGTMVTISPASWLGDRSSLGFRRMLVKGRHIDEVITFRENAGLFDTVNQATAVSILRKEGGCSDIALASRPSKPSCSGGAARVAYQLVQRMDPVWVRIPRLSSRFECIYGQLLKHPKIGEVRSMRNLRGEVDQSLFRSMITPESSQLRFVRGDHVERFVIRGDGVSDRAGYVLEGEYLRRFKDSPKYRDFEDYRVVGRQCSYLQKQRRLSFAMAPPGVAVGNSCNYLSFADERGGNEPSAKLWALEGLLNSAVLEWYFRVYSSNNHVANYEIDSFPVCLHEASIPALAKSTKLLHEAYKQADHGGRIASRIEDFHDALVATCYGLTPKMMQEVMAEVDPSRAAHVRNMLEFMAEGALPSDFWDCEGWFNHCKPSLSALDLEIIKHVPQGGNWQDVPETVPGERLRQIRQMTRERGVVRTTYYGRLRPEQPAYTISTYFNRPGNGANIHPLEDRTLTARDAARLQSFPDAYVFLGSHTAIRKQVGNAVPPLLAYAVGKSIATRTSPGRCVDLFCGAGGLSLGLEMAGWNVVAAADNDKSCLQTYRFNRPCRTSTAADAGTLLVEGDLSDGEVYSQAVGCVKELVAEGLDLLVGGPPCQGFSHAGWRLAHDGRNDLVSVFLRFVADLRPSVVVMENVEGILTAKKGKVIGDIALALGDLGYTLPGQPWVLAAEQYGVPQMRRRVFVVAATTQGLLPEPPEVIFARCAGRRERSQREPLFADLPYPVTVQEALLGLPGLSDSTKAAAPQRLRREYSQWAKGLIRTRDMFSALGRVRRGQCPGPSSRRSSSCSF